MDIQSWIPAATFLTLIISIVSFVVGKLILLWRRSVNKKVLENEFAEKLQKIDDCAVDIHSLQRSYQSISTNLQQLNKTGSEGATNEFKVIHSKLDKLCRKISRLNGRLIRVEGHLNGGLATVPRYAEDDEADLESAP